MSYKFQIVTVVGIGMLRLWIETAMAPLQLSQQARPTFPIKSEQIERLSEVRSELWRFLALDEVAYSEVSNWI